MPWTMADERALEAIARIERALARIEGAAESGAKPTGNARLEEAHHMLRSRVEGAIGEIDRLLEAGERR